MPGILSDMFDGGSDDYAGAQHLGVSDEADVQEEVGVGADVSASYEDADGTSHTYSSSQELNADVDVQATLGVAVDTAEGFGGEG